MKKYLFAAIILVFVVSAVITHGTEKLEPIPPINLVTGTPEQAMPQHEMAMYIADEWRKLGLVVKINPMVWPNPMLATWFKEHNFDVIVYFYSSTLVRMEPDFFTNARFHSSHMAEWGWNTGEYKNPEFDRIGEKQLEIYNPEKRRELIYKLQEILYEDQPETVIAYTIANYAINTSKFDLNYIPCTDGTMSIWNYPRFRPKGTDRLLRIGKYSDQTSWNPVAAVQAEDFWQLRLIYDRLVQVSPDGSVAMWAAKSVNQIDDTTIEVVLREGMKFHDGKPVTTEDVKFSYDYMKKWKAPYFLKYLAPIKEIELIGKDKLRFHLNRPYAPFIMNTLGQVFILPKHIWENIPEKAGLSKPQEYRNVPAIGSGVYKMDYWKEGQEFLYRRHKDHFKAPEVDSLSIVIGSAELINEALKKGTIDASLNKIAPAVAKELEKEKNIKLFKAPGIGFSAVTYHCGKQPFNDKKLRVALSYAIPYDKIVDEILLGQGGRSASTITPTNAFWYNKNLKLRHLDLEKARSILKEAGYRWDDQGRLCYPPK